MNDPDGRSFDGKLQRAEDSEATTGSPLTGGAPGTYVDPKTGKVTQYPGAARPGDVASQLYAGILGSLNAPMSPQGQQVPVVGAADGYAPAGGPGRFTVSPENLQTFASRMQGVHDEYFGPHKPVEITAFQRTAQNVQLGPLSATGSAPLVHVYNSFTEQVLTVLQELQTLVQSLAGKSNASQVTYQEIEDRITQTMRALGDGPQT